MSNAKSNCQGSAGLLHSQRSAGMLVYRATDKGVPPALMYGAQAPSVQWGGPGQQEGKHEDSD